MVFFSVLRRDRIIDISRKKEDRAVRGRGRTNLEWGRGRRRRRRSQREEKRALVEVKKSRKKKKRKGMGTVVGSKTRKVQFIHQSLD